MQTAEPSKPSPIAGRSAVRSGLLTSLSSVALSGAGALAGIYLAHKFGRNARTDGFLAAYGVYLVIVLGAQAFRMVVVPDLTRARTEGRLGSEFVGYALAFVALGVPVSAVVIAFPIAFGDLITGRLPQSSAVLAGHALRWIVPAGFAQLLAALAASALAARDEYAIAAVSFATGGIASLVIFVALGGSHGLIALAWGLAANGAISVGLPLLALAKRGGQLRALRGGYGRVWPRLWRLVNGTAVPLAGQGLYLLALRFAAATGHGNVTSLTYAYLLSAMFVSATAWSWSLVSAAPLTRRGLDAEAAADHVVHSAWVSLVIVGGAVGVVALVGGRVFSFLLGHTYSGHVGTEIGRLVAYLALWMVGWTAFSVTYPLVFVMHRERFLIPLAIATLGIDIPISLVARGWGALTGVAVAFGITTLLMVFGVLATVAPRMLWLTAIGLGRLALVVAATTAAAFGGASLLLPAAPAVALALVLYVVLLVAARQFGLAEAWHYVRALR